MNDTRLPSWSEYLLMVIQMKPRVSIALIALLGTNTLSTAHHPSYTLLFRHQILVPGFLNASFIPIKIISSQDHIPAETAEV